MRAGERLSWSNKTVGALVHHVILTEARLVVWRGAADVRGGGKHIRETRRFGCRRATPSGPSKAAQTLSADDWFSGVRMQLKLLACHI